MERNLALKKSICVISNSAWNIFNFRLSLLRFLEKQGYKIIVFVPKGSYFDKIPFEINSIPLYSRSLNPLKDLYLLTFLYCSLKKIKPFLVISFTIKANLYASLVCSWRKIPIFVNVSGRGRVFSKKSLLFWVVYFLYKVAFTRVTKAFFQNEEDKQFFIQHQLIEEALTEKIPGSGIDVDRYKNKFAEKVHQNKPFRFLFVGRLLWEKGILEYVKACHLLKKKIKEEIVCDVLGILSGFKKEVQKEDLKKWEQEGMIAYLGSSDEVSKVMQKANCVVLPSYYKEGVPRVLLEACSLEIPIITTDHTGCRDVVDHGENGFLCSSKDEQDLFNKMLLMMRLNPLKRKEMGKKGREKVIRFFDEKFIFKAYHQGVLELRKDKK